MERDLHAANEPLLGRLDGSVHPVALEVLAIEDHALHRLVPEDRHPWLVGILDRLLTRRQAQHLQRLAGALANHTHPLRRRRSLESLIATVALVLDHEA